MTYRIVAILMTLSDLHGRAPNAGLLKCNFLSIQLCSSWQDFK